jgi:D-inositol-3-phosphate glycosyltransferase
VRCTFVLWSGAVGGAETVTRSLARTLGSRFAIEAGVLFLGPGGPIERQMREDGLDVHVLGMRRASSAAFHMPEFRAYINTRRPEILVFADYGWSQFVLRHAGYRGPVVVTEHGGGVLNRHLGSVLHRTSVATARRLLSRSTALEICVSEFMRGVQERVPHAARLVVIHNGVDTDEFSPDRSQSSRPTEPGRLRIGAAGRLIPEKGYDTLVRAIAVLPTRLRANVTADIAGEGPDRQRLESLVTEHDVASSVRLVGRVSAMPRFWQSVDIACAASSRRFIESFGLSAVEAQGCGCPAIVSSLGALAEVVEHGVTGTHVEPDDPDSLSRAIAQYADHPSLLHRQAEASRERAVRCFSLDACAAQYSQHLRELVAETG